MLAVALASARVRIIPARGVHLGEVVQCARFAAVVVSLLVLAVVPASAGAAKWVGLGDSFAAGPLIPNQSLSPLGCLRSSNNYARLAAASTGRTLVDVSCSGARTTHMTQSQSTTAGTNPPQLNALTGADRRSCRCRSAATTSASPRSSRTAPPPTRSGGRARTATTRAATTRSSARINATAPKVAAVIQGIRAESPTARILLVNYAAILPETGSGCWPQVPLAYSDVPYMRTKQKQLNAMLATVASENGAVLVDDYTASIGRDACKGSGTRWVEPLVPGNAAAPFHPNARGMRGHRSGGRGGAAALSGA